MKTGKSFRLLALLLALCALMSLPAFAVEGEEDDLGIDLQAACAHTNKYRTGYTETWRSEGASGHRHGEGDTYTCRDCGATFADIVYGPLVAHVKTLGSYTGNDYHKIGTNWHYIEYFYTCDDCHYTGRTYEQTWCSGTGNGDCFISLRMIDPELVTQ